MNNFEWDINKSKLNEAKHKVSFDEAVSVFADTLAVCFDDDAHSILEQRNKLIGKSSKGRMLLVVYTERLNKIRIISTRLLTPKEKEIMKTDKKIEESDISDMLEEYDFDFSKSKPNKFAKNFYRSTIKIYDKDKLVSEKKPVLLDADLIKYFKTSSRINKALRALIHA